MPRCHGCKVAASLRRLCEPIGKIGNTKYRFLRF